MPKRYPDFSIGLEEEVFVVEGKTGKLVNTWPQPFKKACENHFPSQITDEFLCSQLELVTPPAKDIKALDGHLKNLRGFCLAEGQKHDISLIAASTHPTGNWRNATPNQESRYQQLKGELRIASNRMLVGGMHIHIGLSTIKKRLLLLNKITHYLPLMLSLSSSSPFWQGEDTGHVSYRSSVIAGLPRSGKPFYFKTPKAYNAYLTKLLKNNTIQSASDIWWDARLSSRYPTVEIRVSDTCSSYKEAIALAAFILCLSRYLLGNYDKKQKKLREIDEHLWFENIWQAKRYPLNDAKFIDFSISNETSTVKVLIGELLDDLLPQAQFFNCENELQLCYDILENGTSADKQRKIYQQNLKGCEGSQLKALSEVKSFLMKETQKDL